ncbi:unnamed protein product [Rhizoctonia solani]|uniref:Uncharacterized protein n=1 Tax=Rhizoctonia solani TaxID=456999 RepID=A0A8H3DK57_9AGAM|nr:unnamed protein product [Rhizoctonia solani]CAE6534693.1 unnamed protein product [Rhizoctonia solani]
MKARAAGLPPEDRSNLGVAAGACQRHSTNWKNVLWLHIKFKDCLHIISSTFTTSVQHVSGFVAYELASESAVWFTSASLRLPIFTLKLNPSLISNLGLLYTMDLRATVQNPLLSMVSPCDSALNHRFKEYWRSLLFLCSERLDLFGH